MTKQMSLQVRKCQLRYKPSFPGKIISNHNYADSVNVEKLIKGKGEPFFSNAQTTRFQLALSNI